jgi:hypothetical protein
MESGAPHRPQTACFPPAASAFTRFFAPHRAHTAIIAFALPKFFARVIFGKRNLQRSARLSKRGGADSLRSRRFARPTPDVKNIYFETVRLRITFNPVSED